jgi:hypothetical protein
MVPAGIGVVHHIGLEESRGSFTAREEDERIEAP